MTKVVELDTNISIGIAAGDSDLPMRHAYKLADSALYRAKHEGRNRVVTHGMVHGSPGKFVPLADPSK